MTNIYVVDEQYFLNIEDAIKYIENLYGTIVQHNAINKRNQKLICCKNNSITRINIKMVEVCTNANTLK